ncbi:MAG: hypothetical protein F4Y54_08895 [Dehalococcoidia bacterium]|nr:hypothetical protein [Dehalococcoidia bacterium]
MKHRRTPELIERFEEGFYGSIDATGEAISRVNRALSWQPRRMRYQVLVAVLGAALGVGAVFIRFVFDGPDLLLGIVAVLVPAALMTVAGLVMRNYLSRRQREESIADRQREMR